MADFNKFRAGAKRTAKKVAAKTSEFVEVTAAKAKIKTLELRMSGQYEALGKLVYEALRTGVDNEEARSEVLAELDGFSEKITELREKIAQKERETAEKTAEPETTEVGAEESEAAPTEEAPVEEAPVEDENKE